MVSRSCSPVARLTKRPGPRLPGWPGRADRCRPARRAGDRRRRRSDFPRRPSDCRDPSGRRSGDVGPARARSSFLALAGIRPDLRPGPPRRGSKWTTPGAFRARFDARFFAAELPPGTSSPGRERVAALEADPASRPKGDGGRRDRPWPPTSTTLQRLERAPSFDAIREPSTAAAPIRIQQVDPGLRVMTGQVRSGRQAPANTSHGSRRSRPG